MDRNPECAAALPITTTTTKKIVGAVCSYSVQLDRLIKKGAKRGDFSTLKLHRVESAGHYML